MSVSSQESSSCRLFVAYRLALMQALFDVGTFGGLTDGQLLERFLRGRRVVTEAAFTLLVERHGPMVAERLSVRAGQIGMTRKTPFRQHSRPGATGRIDPAEGRGGRAQKGRSRTAEALLVPQSVNTQSRYMVKAAVPAPQPAPKPENEVKKIAIRPPPPAPAKAANGMGEAQKPALAAALELRTVTGHVRDPQG